MRAATLLDMSLHRPPLKASSEMLRIRVWSFLGKVNQSTHGAVDK